ncbi:cysteine desulfurase/selenocysteine lyase [Metamycoplasma hyosynoviae]|uniref:Cysteine desulfurase/selenocysteine lyase n=2 Tax=Metamycoplasma hyosynoviae TaxID=29559 RepID=A0A4R7TVC2_9BACT|nr:cysteine desulfurase/selenocysteine lyase [Metamycoplasma hyosynoviae]
MMKNWKIKFPMFKNNKNIVYFDNSALTFKPYSVIEKGNEFYEKYSISTRTANSILGIKVIQEIEETRKNVSSFINGQDGQIIFTSGTTESLNLIVKMLSSIIKEGKILLSKFNHSSNIVPFIENFKTSKKVLIDYFEDENDLIEKIKSDTISIVSLSQMTNNYNVKYDLENIYKYCKTKNIILINDAAQAIAHEKVSLENCDVIAFSANKMYGPTGVGVLAIKNNLFEKLEPTKWGGGQVHNIDYCTWISNTNISKFEPGTHNICGILQLNEAIKFVQEIGYEEIQSVEKEVANYLYDKLSGLKNIEIKSNHGDIITLFNVKNIPSQDIASYLGHKNIYVRSGLFCAQMTTKIDNFENSYVRVSLSFYNNFKDVDTFINALKEGGEFIDYLF